MRRKCVNLCKSEGGEDHYSRSSGEEGRDDGGASSSRGTGFAVRLLRQQPCLRRVPRGASFVPSQGLESSVRSAVSHPQFSICADGEETGDGREMPWRRFEGVGVRSKENAVSRERWSEVRLKQQAGAVRKQAAPFAVYSEGRRSVGQAVLGGSQSEKMGDLNGQLGSVVGQAEGCGWFGGQGNGQSISQSTHRLIITLRSQPINRLIRTLSSQPTHSLTNPIHSHTQTQPRDSCSETASSHSQSTNTQTPLRLPTRPLHSR